MPWSRKPAGPGDQLDAVLDGQPGPVAGELAPLLQAAEALRTTCARMELDPAVAQQHLGQVLGAAAVDLQVPELRTPEPHTPELRAEPDRLGGRAIHHAPRRPRWRRVAALALAAAVVVAPLVALAGRTLPGEPLYPVKLTVENARLAAAHWSPRQRADLRTRFASTRLHELDGLVGHGRVDQIPTAIVALDSALVAAQHAVGAAGRGPDSTLDQRLRELRARQTAELTSLVERLPSTTPTAARIKIEGAVQHSLSTQSP